MKKNLIIKSIIPALTVVLSFSSCLKDENIQQDFTHLKPMVEIGDTSPNVDGAPNSTTLGMIGNTTPVTFNLELRYAYSAPSPGLAVTIDIDPTVLTKYNTVKGTARQVLPAALYSIANKTVTIPAGSNSVKLPIVVANPSLIAPTTPYAIPLRITNASGVDISGNFGSHVVVVIIKNIYDGVYSRIGNIQRNSATGPDPALSGNYTAPDASLTTDGQFSNWYVSPTWSNGTGIAGIGTPGLDGIKFTVDPATNKVTASCPANPLVANTPGKDNYYDPATRTFHVAFQWGALPNTRVIEETLKWIKPTP